MILKQLRDDTRGAVLVEFSVTIAFFLLLTFGLIQAGLLLWTKSAMQHGVESGCSLRERQLFRQPNGAKHKLLH